ncbi:hypothetical protein BDV95DRAFT_220959 [Massariosphaeria phaeospora]|uniref:Uncharacterized protein n=1 Tax=Massariosphaeria phaeospora TaxID=100035 RepID=A0A7C8IMT7_9PLEO|nr:hypothetical protein BDV95DRAFT_220959 [Massariosphaeria phaeospora]
MPPPSENSILDYERLDARVRHGARDLSPEPSEPTAATDIIVHCGGGFSDRGGAPYPPDLEFSEEENDPEAPRRGFEPSLSHLHLQPGQSSSSSLGSPQTTPTPTRAHLASYIQAEDFPEFARRRSKRRSNRRREHSSASPTEGSENASSTSLEESNTGEDGADQDRITTPIAYFSPSHTPSHHSAGTEEEDRWKGLEPGSPHPYSSYNPYNAKYGKAAVDGFDRTFHGHK